MMEIESNFRAWSHTGTWTNGIIHKVPIANISLRLIRPQLRQCQHFARRAVRQIIVRTLCRLWQVASSRKPVLQVWAHILVDTSRDFYFSQRITNKMKRLHNLFISVRRSTCFRRVFRPSSGVKNCTYSGGRYLPDQYLSDQYCHLLLAWPSSSG